MPRARGEAETRVTFLADGEFQSHALAYSLAPQPVLHVQIAGRWRKLTREKWDGKPSLLFFYPSFPFVLAAYNLTRSAPTERQKQAICSIVPEENEGLLVVCINDNHVGGLNDISTRYLHVAEG